MKPVTVAQMQEIDRRSEIEFAVPSLELMENAGRAAAKEALRLLSQELKLDPANAKIVICCGRGNNGGDGLACARHLKEMGTVHLAVFRLEAAKNKPLRGEVKAQLERAQQAKLPLRLFDNASALREALSQADLIIDALLGTGVQGKPLGPMENIVKTMMHAKKPILALDVPSGLNPDSGHHTGAFIAARWTVTFGLPKQGLLRPMAQPYVGQLIVADIGHPPELLKPYL